MSKKEARDIVIFAGAKPCKKPKLNDFNFVKEALEIDSLMKDYCSGYSNYSFLDDESIPEADKIEYRRILNQSKVIADLIDGEELARLAFETNQDFCKELGFEQTFKNFDEIYFDEDKKNDY